MKRIAGKFLTFYILLRYPSVPSHYRYYIRFYYIGKLKQLKFWWKDYIVKKPYKIIQYNGEFQQELLFVLPFAYWHYKNGTLKKTIAAKNTSSLYFFSPDHEEVFEKRNWKEILRTDFPNNAHCLKFNFGKWLPVPFKEIYENNIFIYPKPILVIANRYNTEWQNELFSFFDLPVLERLFNLLTEKYQVLYNRPLAHQIVNDVSEVLDLNEHEWIRKKFFGKVILMEDLFEANKETIADFNRFQLMVYANSKGFISVHGGTATLASCFGGINIIYSVKGHEHYFKEFETIFPKLSGASIYHAKTGDELLMLVKEVLV